MLETVEFDTSIYRVVEEINGVAHNLGTCFHIGGGIFLTCWHVLASHESLKGKEIRENVIHFSENTYLTGGQPERLYNLTWRRHWDNEYNQYFDIAAGRLPPGESVPKSIPFYLNFIPREEPELRCRGYGENNGNLKGTRTVQCAGTEGRTGYFIMDNSLAPGYSGSPVFKDGRVAGIVCADNIKKSCSYGIGLNRIWHWLESVYGPIDSHPNGKTFTDVEYEVSRYPLSIDSKVNAIQTEELVFIALLRLKNIEDTEAFLRKVNNVVLAVTDIPNAERTVCIDEFGVSKHTVKSFIRDMLANATAKSARTLGAILETDTVFSESLLTASQQRIVQQAKQLLGKK